MTEKGCTWWPPLTALTLLIRQCFVPAALTIKYLWPYRPSKKGSRSLRPWLQRRPYLRMSILPVLLKTFGLETLGTRLKNNLTDKSGADLSALVRQAATISLQRALTAKESEFPQDVDTIAVEMEHFDEAFNSVRPSVSDQSRL